MSFFQKNILTKDELATIVATINAVERETIGEVRVKIHKSRSFKEKHLSLYDLAVKSFYELGMDKTKDKSGVLIFLLLSEHAFQIIGDEGINRKVTKEFWDSLAAKTSDYFRRNKFAEGICYAVNEVGVILKKEFPMKPGDTNELSNEVVIS